MKILLGQFHHQIAQRFSLRIFQKRRALQQGFAAVHGRPIHRLPAGIFRREQDAPPGGKGGACCNAAGGIAQTAPQIIQRVIRQIPAALSGQEQGGIDLGVLPAGKSPGQQAAFFQRSGCPRQGVADPIQGGHQVGGLGLGVGVQLLRHLNPGNLGQHGGADDHGCQRGDQEG